MPDEENSSAEAPLAANIPVPSPELISAAGEALSKSTLFTLRREYLDAPVFERGTLKVEKLKQKPVDAAFVAIEQVGQPVAGDEGLVLNAIQTTLAACHDPRYALVFLLSSDGMRNSLYLGVTAREESTQPRLFAEQVGQFLCSNWPGTRVRAIDDSGQMAAQVHVPLSSYRYARAFTGIPSTRAELTSTEAPPSAATLRSSLAMENSFSRSS